MLNKIVFSMSILISFSVCGPALAANSSHAIHKQASCKKEPYASAFQWEAIKSDLTLNALLCRTHDEYNAWATENREFLQHNDGKLAQFFKRAGDAQHNSYITNLVNTQEETRHRISGNEYCVERENIYKDANMANRDNPKNFMEKYKVLQVSGYQPCE